MEKQNGRSYKANKKNAGVQRLCLIAAVALLLLIPTIESTNAQAGSVQNGLSYASWSAWGYSQPDADLALEQLAETGANWISLIVTGYQNNVSATTISITTDATPIDTALIHAITKAHALGLHVMLKPHVDFSNDPNHWRGEIGNLFTNEAEWNAWFNTYQNFIVHYAELAQAYNIEQFCVGTELIGTTHRTDNWRAIIASVRTHYDGPITYAANHSGEETQITWWDAVDYIGIDAYYPLTDENDPSLEALKAGWQPYISLLAELSANWDRPILFTEIGYASQDGANRHPARQNADGILDLQEQADAYQAVFESVYDQPWFSGVFWWVWYTDPFAGGSCDPSHTPREKPAEDVLRTWYGGAARPLPTPTPLPDYSRTMDIYNDTLSPGWEDWSWNAISNLWATEQIYSGTNAISAGLYAWGALSLHTDEPINPNTYHWLEFYIRGSTPGTQNLWAFFNNTTGDALRKRPIDDCRYMENGTIEADVWKHVRIPLSDLNTWEYRLQQLSFQDRSGQAPTIFWVDEIRLVAAEPLQAIYLPLVIKLQ